MQQHRRRSAEQEPSRDGADATTWLRDWLRRHLGVGTACPGMVAGGVEGGVEDGVEGGPLSGGLDLGCRVEHLDLDSTEVLLLVTDARRHLDVVVGPGEVLAQPTLRSLADLLTARAAAPAPVG